MVLLVAGWRMAPVPALVTGLVAALATTLLWSRRDRIRVEPGRLAITAIALVVFLATAQVLLRHTIDLSTDGASYHAPSIDLLLRGWNPVYETHSDWRPPEDLVWLQIEHFPKLAWIVEASTAAVQGHVQSARLFGFVWLATAALVLPALILSTVLSHPAAWMARYVAQLWAFLFSWPQRPGWAPRVWRKAWRSWWRC